MLFEVIENDSTTVPRRQVHEFRELVNITLTDVPEADFGNILPSENQPAALLKCVLNQLRQLLWT